MVTENKENETKRMERLKHLIEEKLKLKAENEPLLALQNERLTVVTAFQLFCAEFVGMVREKAPMINKLKESICNVARERKELLRKRRLHDQDDLVRTSHRVDKTH